MAPRLVSEGAALVGGRIRTLILFPLGDNKRR
jgi:hypothetical protein